MFIQAIHQWMPWQHDSQYLKLTPKVFMKQLWTKWSNLNNTTGNANTQPIIYSNNHSHDDNIAEPPGSQWLHGGGCWQVANDSNRGGWQPMDTVGFHQHTHPETPNSSPTLNLFPWLHHHTTHQAPHHPLLQIWDRCSTFKYIWHQVDCLIVVALSHYIEKVWPIQYYRLCLRGKSEYLIGDEY